MWLIILLSSNLDSIWDSSQFLESLFCHMFHIWTILFPHGFMVYVQSWFTEVLLDDGPSLFFPKVSKIFHKTANSFSVYIFLSLTGHSSKMCVVISWNLCLEAKLFERAIINIIFVLICCLYVTLNISKKQIKTKNVNF